MPDVRVRTRHEDHSMTFTYKGRTWDLTAYALEDFGFWDAVAHERGTDGPALPAAEWDVTETLRGPSDALSILTGAIILKVNRDAFWNAKLIEEEDHAGHFSDPDFEGDSDGTA